MLTRIESGIYGGRRTGSFAGRVTNTHPVGNITRIASGLWGGKRAGSFAGKQESIISVDVGGRKRINEEEEMMFMAAAMLPTIIRRTKWHN